MKTGPPDACGRHRAGSIVRTAWGTHLLAAFRVAGRAPGVVVGLGLRLGRVGGQGVVGLNLRRRGCLGTSQRVGVAGGEHHETHEEKGEERGGNRGAFHEIGRSEIE